jgi:hypothetical protein
MWPSKKVFLTLSPRKSQWYVLTQCNRSAEHMASLLAQIIFRSYKPSLLRQQTVNQSLLSIYVYINAALERVLANYVALLWDENGQPWLTESSVASDVTAYLTYLTQPITGLYAKFGLCCFVLCWLGWGFVYSRLGQGTQNELKSIAIRFRHEIRISQKFVLFYCRRNCMKLIPQKMSKRVKISASWNEGLAFRSLLGDRLYRLRLFVVFLSHS